MKRLIVSLVIIVVLGGFCYLGNYLTQKTYDKVLKTVENSEEYMQKDEEALAKSDAKRAEEQWVKSEKYLAIFINHDLIDEVGLKLSQLEPFATRDTKEEFFAAVKSVKTALIHMRNGQIPSVETVM